MSRIHEVLEDSRRTSYELANIHDAQWANQHHQSDSVNSRQKLSSSNPPRNRWRKAVIHLWLWEWLAWLIALLAIAAIVGVLVAFDNKLVPDWPWGITLGALVSVLATIATVGLAEPLAAGLGQARWLWYTEERRLADFEMLDDASRGPIGSAWLVIRGKGGFLAIVGGLLLIASQAVGPFAQQVVQYGTSTLTTTTGSVPIAQSYNTYAADGGDVSLSMKAAVLRGMMDASANTSTFDVSAQCPTGNCTWPDDKSHYTSLSVCSRCIDVSTHLTISDNGEGYANISLPNNVTLEYSPGLTKEGLIAMTVNTTSNALALEIDSLEYSQWSYPIVDVFTLIAEYGDNTATPFPNGSIPMLGPFASECIIQFCVQNLSAKSVNGQFSEESHGDPVFLNGTYTFNVTQDNTDYSLDYETFKALYAYFNTLFNKVVEQSNGLSASTQWNDDVSQSLFYWTNSSSNHLPTQMFQDMAASMSLNVRSASNLSESGLASSQVSVVNVRWPWMVLPFAVLGLVGAFLIWVVIATKRRGLEPWKNSSLAVLMHGMRGEESRRLIERAEGLDEMAGLAANLWMRSERPGVIVDRGDVDGTRTGSKRVHTSMAVR